jgi:hypothetical protein
MRACCLLIALAALSGAAGLGDVPAKPATPSNSPSIYVKKATWTETMLATRAAYQELLAREARDGKPAAREPFATEAVRGDGPGLRISLDVRGIRSLRLVSQHLAGGGNIYVWGEARLIDKQGRETPLSALQPLYVQVGWGEMHRDRNWQRRPLQIADRTFRHGLWVHANADVCYALDGRYERFETWVGMDAARAVGSARFQVVFDRAEPVAAAWSRLKADFPVQTGWLMNDGWGHQVEWFRDAQTTHHDEALIQRSLGQLGTAGRSLTQELNTLRQSKTPADDPRWLNLYARARRAGDCLAAAAIPQPEILAAVRVGLDDLARQVSSPNDPRWAQRQSQLQQLATQVAQLPAVDVSRLADAVDTLSKALPDRFTPRPGLSQRIADCQRRWQKVLPDLGRGEASAVRQVAAWDVALQQLRGEMLRSLRGMGEFLDARGVDLQREWQSQHEVLRADLANRAHFDKVAPETFRREALILASDRDPADLVLRRTAALVADLRHSAERHQLASVERDLQQLQAAADRIDPSHTEARYVVFAEACRLRRLAALANPLLDFADLLFIKRHRPGFNHMCDQYYGITARPGGGLYVLEGAFGPRPRVRDVLANAVVERGRLKGQRLQGGPTTPPTLVFDGVGNLRGPDCAGGCFLAPDLSYDARHVLFAFVECQGDRTHDHHTDPTRGHWAPGRCFHVFRVDLDGHHLEQLTDGTWNDFDPCWLPNGRVAFISERRGGYLRCGRVCPTYTLYEMAANGSDINCLSFHETNEWQPSVTHDGRIIYTRWDYVDRHGCTAHLPWITTLDGRDSRAVHGNFAPRPARPDMELDVRAVPDSQKYVATAAPHHGQSFGSLVLVDPRVEDDDAMAPVRRITPDVGFPESQGGDEAYGTAWPLSEDYYLCVYDADRALHRRTPLGGYGIYLVDAWGNKELIYRDAEIACQSPIPVKARQLPPTSALTVAQTRADPSVPATIQRPAEATLSVINVYESLKGWPEGTKIKALRVFHALPMSVPSGSLRPHETGMRIGAAGDSVVLARRVLGTVPVEADGSAHFTVPANRELFFQALDDQGLAVQSMRSATYLREGERLVCQGCHEPKHRAPLPLPSTPIALQRNPSRITPDVDGSNPFSYPRLVQPVLDRQCAKCHEAQRAKGAPNLGREPLQRFFYASYVSLAPRFGFYDYGDAYRTRPGQFGAKASKLWELLEKGHYDVKLSADERHRIALWLDCCSMFYGVYEKEEGEKQLRGEIARPTLE